MIPNDLQRQRPGTIHIHPIELTSTTEAVQQYRHQGGQLTDPYPFVSDPLAEDDTMIQERHSRFSRDFLQGYDYQLMFTSLINGNSYLCSDLCLYYLINFINHVCMPMYAHIVVVAIVAQLVMQVLNHTVITSRDENSRPSAKIRSYSRPIHFTISHYGQTRDAHARLRAILSRCVQ